MIRKYASLFFGLLLTWIFVGAALAAPKIPATVAELAFYKGADRQQLLEEGAKKEGRLTLYTTGTFAKNIVNAFQKKYPYIRVNAWRASESAISAKAVEEYKAGKSVADVVEGNKLTALFLQNAGIIQPFYSPHLAAIEEDGNIKAQGDSVFAAAFRESGLGLGFNTKLINRERAPKTYADLLDPQWKGKGAMGVSGQKLIGTLFVHHGEDFLKQLAKQEFAVHMISGRALLDMVINGEYALSPTIYDSQLILAKAKGAPIDWMPLEPVHINTGLLALPKHAPHPHAALLFIDYDLSKEGAEIYKTGGYNPTRKDVAALVKAYKKFYSMRSLEEGLKWNELFGRLFLKK